jgi:hypothetical protein
MSLQNATNPAPGVADGNSSATAAAASTETATGEAGAGADEGEADEGTVDDGTDEGQDGTEGDGELGDGEEGEGEGAEAESEFAEVEDDDGAKHKIPAKLKAAFLKNADYTQKTQQHAETVRAFEAQQTVAREVINELAELKGIDRQLAEYKKVDWDAFQAQNPDQANSAWRQYQLLKEQRVDAVNAVQKKAGEVTEAQQREHAKLVEAGRQQLQKDIPGWSDKLASDVVQYGASKFGFTREEIAAVTDPRMIKVLHAAMTNEQKSKTAAKVKNVLAAQETRPVPQARPGGASQPKDPNKMNPAQYRKWRSSQGLVTRPKGGRNP